MSLKLGEFLSEKRQCCNLLIPSNSGFDLRKWGNSQEVQRKKKRKREGGRQKKREGGRKKERRKGLKKRRGREKRGKERGRGREGKRGERKGKKEEGSESRS